MELYFYKDCEYCQVVFETIAKLKITDKFIFKDIKLNTNTQIICNEFIDRLENLSSLLNIPSKLRDLDIPKEACVKMAKEAMKQTRLLVNNPREVTEEDAFNIYNATW